MIEVDLLGTPRKTQRQVAIRTLKQKVAKIIAIQDNNEETILVRGERMEKIMHEREEGRGWEPNLESILGFDMNMMMSHLEDPLHTFFKELNIEISGEKDMVTL